MIRRMNRNTSLDCFDVPCFPDQVKLNRLMTCPTNTVHNNKKYDKRCNRNIFNQLKDKKKLNIMYCIALF